MNLLDDPSMKPIIDDFCDETQQLLENLEEILEELEDNPNSSGKLEEFGQVIDRVMGAAKSIGAEEIGTFCELGKTIGYKSSQANDPTLVEVVIAILFDAVELLNKMVSSLKTGDDNVMANLNTKAFGTRLKWLSEKFKDIDRSSVAITNNQDTEENMSQASIDDLMSSLGL